jgi:uncharacterized protein (TIRG00374 family)
VGVPYKVLDFLPLLFSGVFVNTVTPSGGTAGVALFVRDASRRGQPAGRAAAGNVLATVIEYVTFALVLFLALIYLFFRHDLKTYELVGAAVLLLWIGIQAAALFLAAWKPLWLRNALGFIYQSVAQIFTRLRLRFRASAGWADKTAGEFVSAARAVKTRPETLIWTGPTALAMHAAGIATLYCLFLAFHQKVSLGPLVSGFAVGMLFVNISPVPQGIGIVEGTMTLVYTSLGVPSGWPWSSLWPSADSLSGCPLPWDLGFSGGPCGFERLKQMRKTDLEMTGRG